MWSLPARERGLKLLLRHRTERQVESLPARERGLKLTHEEAVIRAKESLPARERGLKHIAHNGYYGHGSRSPHGSVD